MSKDYMTWIVKLANGYYIMNPEHNTVTLNREYAHGWRYKSNAVTEAKSHPGSSVGRKGKLSRHDQLVK